MKDVCGALLAVTLWVSVTSSSHHYRNNSEINTFLTDMETAFPNIATVYSIGKSVKGFQDHVNAARAMIDRAVTISRNEARTASFSTEAAFWMSAHQVIEGNDLKVIQLAGPNVSVGTPHVKLVGNIHGNEPLGRELLLRLADFLISGYESGDSEATTILNSMYVHILPTMNPDGFEEALEGECVNGRGRRNMNGKDLNRDFPSKMYSDETQEPVQPETAAIMEWMYKYTFVLSAALHGGALVANYPYDVAKTKEVHDLQQILQGPDGYERLMAMLSSSPSDFPGAKGPQEHKTEDNDVFRAMALNYAAEHRHMADSNECPDSGDHDKFERGVTNGAAWYSFTGSMGDYNYDFHSCLELTLELSCCKYPGAHKLQDHWNENQKALLSFMKYSQRGVKGVIFNGTDGEPVAKAAITVMGRSITHYTTENGEYWVLLLPGTYWLEVESNEKKFTRKIKVPESLYDNPVIVNLNLVSATSDDLLRQDTEEDSPSGVLLDGVDSIQLEEFEEAHEVMVEERKKMHDPYDDETVYYPEDAIAGADTCRLNTFIYIIGGIFSIVIL